MSRTIAPPTSLVKPTAETRFQIDYTWWERSGHELKLYLAEHLCDYHREMYPQLADDDNIVDWIDPVTGRVFSLDRLTYTLLHHCRTEADYVSERISLVDAVFRTLIAAGNRPMTPTELAKRTGRSAETILRTLSGRTVYKGIRPI